MYAALWRSLPGPTWVRVLIAVLLVVAVVLFCFEVFFPWLARLVPLNEQTVGLPQGRT